MAKKKRSEKHIHKHHTAELEQPGRVFSFKDLEFPWLAMGIILLLTILVYLPVFKAGFVWDDVYYIQTNQLIRDMDMGDIFSKYVMGNYHPFTMLAFGIQFQLFGLNETGYHIVNLLLHLTNVMLVYYALFLFTKKSHIALVAALLFGIHPLHTESVAWISELKDLLYTTFFLTAYIFYLKFLGTKQKNFFFLALLFFLFSLFSKAMAASLPLLLLLTDYFKGRKMDLKIWVEKVPFFLLAIIFGVVAVFAQRSSEAIQDISSYSLPQRIIFACYGFVTYLWKSFLPVYQSAFYPYPIKSGESLGATFYIYPLLFLAVVALAIYSRRFTKKIIFGLGFFAITVGLVLQLLPVGDAVMADRYSYIPSIGLFYLAGEGFYWLWNKRNKTLAWSLLSVFILLFSIFTYSRNMIWENGISLWSDVIKKFPNAAVGYNNRGGTFLSEKKYDEALADLNKAIQLRPAYAEALSNRGIILSDRKKPEEALIDLNKAISLRPNYADAINNRGIILMELNKYSEALNDFNRAIEIRPGYAEAYYNRGLLFMNENKYDQAVKDYDKALELRPGYPEAVINRGIILNDGANSEKLLTEYNNALKTNPNDPELYYSRGIALMNLNKFPGAISDFTKAISLKADHSKAYLSRGNAYVNEKDTIAALNDYTKVIEIDKKSADAYIGRGNIMRDQNKNELALKDYNKAIELNPSAVNAYHNRGILLIREKKFEEVINDFSKVLELKGDSAMGYYNLGMAKIFLDRKEFACHDLKIAADFGMQSAIDAYKQFCQ